jgi:CubicO group peptidase (beta-lactamase class C family)
MKDTGFHVAPENLPRFATQYIPDPSTGALNVYDAPEGEWSRPPAFPSASGGLVSTADDYLAFGRMMLGGGTLGNERILSRPSVLAMTTNQLTPRQRAGTELFLHGGGWGLGMAVVTERDGVAASPGRFGWDGGLGTSWHCDPAEDLVGILMSQVAWTSPTGPTVWKDFWTSVYQAIDD